MIMKNEINVEINELLQEVGKEMNRKFMKTKSCDRNYNIIETDGNEYETTLQIKKEEKGNGK